MTLEEYKKAIRKYRGHLKNDTAALEDIYNNSCKEFLDFTLGTKARGVRWMALLATTASIDKQIEFVNWFSSDGVKHKRQIDTWCLENI